MYYLHAMSHRVYLYNITTPSAAGDTDKLMMEWGYEMPLLLQPLLIDGAFISGNSYNDHTENNAGLYYSAAPGKENLKRFYNFLEQQTGLITNMNAFTEVKNNLFRYLDTLDQPYFNLDIWDVFNMEETPHEEQAATWLADIKYNNEIISQAMDNNDISLLLYKKLKNVTLAFNTFSELLNYEAYDYGWAAIYKEIPQPEIYQENDLWGLKDSTGQILLPPRFDEFYEFTDQDLALVMKDGKYGYVDTSGKLVVPLIWDDAYDFDESGVAIVKQQDQFGLVDTAGKVIVSPEYDEMSRKAPGQGFAYAFKGDKVYLADKYGLSRANKELVKQDAESEYWHYYYNEDIRARLLAYAESPSDDDAVIDAYTPVEELYNIGVDAYNKHDYQSAIHYYTLAAEKGYGYAMNNLAHIYYMVDGYIDPEKAFYWYEQGAAADNTNAINGLSLCYQNGIGTTPDMDKAIDLLHRAAADGLATAHNNLGYLYYEDNDPERSLYHYQQAEAMGEPDNSWLGALYQINGDTSTAITYLQKAITEGYDQAHIELARIYLQQENKELAAKHVKAAEAAGIEIPGDLK
jgi:TPR repeat protein